MRVFCSISGVELPAHTPLFDSPCYQRSAIHPEINLSAQDADTALLRLSDYQISISCSTELWEREAQLRLATLAVAREIDALAPGWTAPNLMRPQATPTLDLNLLHVIAVDAAAMRVLRTAYSQGMPKIARVDLGCWARLLDACIGARAEEEIAERMLKDVRVKTSLDYELRCVLTVQPAVLHRAVTELAEKAQLPFEVSNAVATELFKSYITSKLKVASKLLQSSTLEDDLCDTTTMQMYEFVQAIPLAVRMSNFDYALIDALEHGASAYLKKHESDYRFLQVRLDRKIEAEAIEAARVESCRATAHLGKLSLGGGGMRKRTHPQDIGETS